MTQPNTPSVLSIDVEDWFHILDSPASPQISEWSRLPLRAHLVVEKLLEILDRTSTRATFFWLGWMAERFPELVRGCRDAGHEIASHGYGHVLAYDAGPRAFEDDIVRAKDLLESIIGQRVRGFRAPGFGITTKAPWAFDVIKAAGYEYDSSVFPVSRGHGGLPGTPVGPYLIQTQHGTLPEIPMSVVRLLGRHVCLFGGGYLRVSPKPLIRWGLGRLRKAGMPLVVYLHPRELDPDHPRLPLGMLRRFKSYVNLKSTQPKLQWLCESRDFVTMGSLANDVALSATDEPIRLLVPFPEEKRKSA